MTCNANLLPIGNRSIGINYSSHIRYLIVISSICFFIACISIAHCGEIRITSIEYPRSPETLSIGEKVPIVVNVEYNNIEDSTFSVHFAYKDFPPRFQMGPEVRLSGSGTYTFLPSEIIVPAAYSIPLGWPDYINEWHLTGQIWKGDILRAGKDFTLLVENPEFKPDLEINKIEYVMQPDTIAVGEASMVKVHMHYSNLDLLTKAEAKIRDKTGIIAKEISRDVFGDGDYIFTLTIKPNETGQWKLEASVSILSGQLLLGDKKSFIIKVV